MKSIESFNSCITEFWDQHQDEFYMFLLSRVADPEKAKDLLSELFLKARDNFNSFCDMAQPRAWIYRSAKNLITDEHRRNRDCVDIDKIDFPAGVEQSELVTLTECLPEAMNKLPEATRTLLRECDLERRQQKEVAAEMGITLPALKSRLLRARESLKEIMADLCAVEEDESSKVCCHRKTSTYSI
ncbi:sigma-70 family RNA polymerase sigma factor [Dongshaea marina]|uniref:sigma-70 family RNA polymerase sigma factor n=1 Tax=Dongshaea marina TaxID=2047966 RepID=UPI000D3E29BE|nr:sigma-70 family RNA polymerase sigma factor [Dongshaea marina]